LIKKAKYFLKGMKTTSPKDRFLPKSKDTPEIIEIKESENAKQEAYYTRYLADYEKDAKAINDMKDKIFTDGRPPEPIIGSDAY